jgi:hypothetical protein
MKISFDVHPLFYFNGLLITSGLLMDMISYAQNILHCHNKLKAMISTINFLAGQNMSIHHLKG